jgi:beta-galactosidase
MGLPPEDALSFFDQNGVVVRRSGMLDGEAIGYHAIENDPELQKLYNSRIKVQLQKNWLDQMVAQVKGERNHPSINIWSIENEWLYINCINLHGGEMDEFESWVAQVEKAVEKTDPTRFIMTDGGGANKDQSMPIHGNHYVFNSDAPENYPALAYQDNVKGGGRGRWVWDQKRPRFLGEDFFATGINPFDYSYFGGDVAFLGKAEATPAAGLVFRMLTEGYRWAEFAGWQLWLGKESATGQYASNPHRAAFIREWDWTFGSGQQVMRTVGLFNDTRFSDPVKFSWTLMLKGKKVAGQSSEHHIKAGENEKFSLTLEIPKVNERLEGELILALAVAGKDVFHDAKQVSVLPLPSKKPPGIAQLKNTDLWVYDPSNGVQDFLTSNKISHGALTNLDNLPETGKVLVVGKDALSAVDSMSSSLAAWASSGRRVIVLEQSNPLKYQGLPAEMNAENNEGRTAFIEDGNHPIMRGLQNKDFFTWGADEVVYRNAYEKPKRNAKSLIQCHRRLGNSALAEVPVGTGLVLPCQLVVGSKLTTNIVAQQLLLNMIDYAAQYKLEFRVTAAVADPSTQFAQALDVIGLSHTRSDNVLSVLDNKKAGLVLIDATPANLKVLADNLLKVKTYNEAGGMILFNGLTPDGLADYNKIVGFEHMIRPFWREKVSFPAQRHPLTAGLTTGDIVLRSGERIFGWTSDEYVADDMFSYVVDYTDVAPFAKFEDDFRKLMVNGFGTADAWKYIVNLPVEECKFRLELPKPQELVSMRWVGNTIYFPATHVEFTFDGKDKTGFDLKPTNDPQDLSFEPSRTGKVIQMNITQWELISDRRAVSGLDNVYLYAQRPAEFLSTVKPLLNVGAMMYYQRGKGGIVLANLLFKANEAVPENAGKKRNILATVLRNLGAPFGGGKTIIAGAPLTFTPIDISKQATQYRNERGWFGDQRFSFKDLPAGAQRFAGVSYDIFEFLTSPTPTCIMLEGPNVPNNPPKEVKGIVVNRKADALFFLQTARIHQRINEQERKQGTKQEILRYIVHYADGREEIVPVLSEINVDDYKVKQPQGLSGAQLAWTRPYEGTEFQAAAYAQQWNNPRPEVQIQSIDVLPGTSRYGTVALLAITAASAP